MRKLLYIIILLALAICFTSCRTSRSMDTEKHVDYSGDFLYLRNLLESLRVDVNKQTKINSEKLSELNIENKTIDLSPPDSTGKQYPIRESTTKASKQEHENTEVNEILLLTMQQFSNRIDTISNKVDALLNEKKRVVELSWWDLHKGKVYVGIIALIVVGWLVYRIRRK